MAHTQPFYNAPTFNIDTGQWSYTPFEKRKDALAFVVGHTKYPGQYNLKYSQGVWNEQAVFFQTAERTKNNGHYPKFVKDTVDFRRHWDFEEEKCKFEGFLIYRKPSENLEYVVPCLYYWYLNYCPIPDKVKQRNDFPEIYDGDLHYYLYILRCILRRRYGVVVKKRQFGFTLKNMSIMLNAGWFGRSIMSKIFAYDENKVKESWEFMTLYRDHNNRHCAWKRGFDPGKSLDWHMRRKQTDGSYKGRNCQWKGFTTRNNPTNGIGGSAKIIFGEEAGANPTLDQTHEFIQSNVSLGGLTTGLIIYSGAVGELDQAEPLKDFMLHPEDHGFEACVNTIEDDIEFGDKVGFFAPEWWNYVSVERDENDEPVGEPLKCYDENGNTNKELALSEIAKWRQQAKKRGPEKYRYYCSQRPLSIKEAFAFRKEMVFPANLVLNQERRIEEGEYPCEHVDIVINVKGELEIVKSDKLPIRDFPIKPSTENKEGVICMWERPYNYPQRPEFGKHYYYSVDPVGEGKTTTSESLFSIIIYKLDTEVITYGEQGAKSRIEPGKIVASWCGRFDDINKTHQRAQYMIELYNAYGIVENNVTAFITHMIHKKRAHHMAQRDQILFLKELGANTNVFQAYGWKNTGTLFKSNLISYGVEFTKEVIDSEVEADGKIVKDIHGIQRIPDLMLIKEMKAYYDGLNVDRLVTFCSLVAFVKLQLANRGYVKRVEHAEKRKTDPKLYAKPSSFFKERGSVDSKYKVNKSSFRNLR